MRPLLALAITWVHTLTYGDLLVGVGTLALAGITAYLGIETRATARAARQAVEGSEEPFVIATPTDQAELMQLRNHEKPHSRMGCCRRLRFTGRTRMTPTPTGTSYA